MFGVSFFLCISITNSLFQDLETLMGELRHPNRFFLPLIFAQLPPNEFNSSCTLLPINYSKTTTEIVSFSCLKSFQTVFCLHSKVQTTQPYIHRSPQYAPNLLSSLIYNDSLSQITILVKLVFVSFSPKFPVVSPALTLCSPHPS